MKIASKLSENQREIHKTIVKLLLHCRSAIAILIFLFFIPFGVRYLAMNMCIDLFGIVQKCQQSFIFVVSLFGKTIIAIELTLPGASVYNM